jgi:predicted metal-dependent phosphoesterase TrpH
VIDLHLHTTASDGRSSPDELVRELVSCGVTTFAVTDHDTTAALDVVLARGAGAGLRCVPGIELTAVSDARDVHVLGYFFKADHPDLIAFLDRQRDDRRRRLTDMAALLAKLGRPVDISRVLEATAPASGKALGRPLLADALVAAGHVATVNEAFERYLSSGRPAFVERVGATPAVVVELVHRAGGLTSLAHPGKLGRDDLIPALVDAGLTAIEIHHPDHDVVDVHRYRALARRYGVLVTGGSDYHGRGSGRINGLGRVQLPADEFRSLAERAGWDGV